MQTELEPVRFSRLKLFAKSAAHYEAQAREETASLRKGSAVHSYLLGDRDSVVVYEDGARNPRHKKYQDFLAENDGKLILSPSEFVAVDGMRRSIEKHPRALQLLDGIREQRITWTDAGRECAGTPDVLHLSPDGRKRAVELKTTKTSNPSWFRFEARRLLYHAQCAWYRTGLERTMMYRQGPVTEFHVVAVESTEPYPVTVFTWDEASLDLGMRQCRLWFEQLLNCERTGHFPAYVESDVILSVVDEEETELDWGSDEEAA